MYLRWQVYSTRSRCERKQQAGRRAAGHTGFEKVVVGKEGRIDTHCLAHYLHHKYFECNYADGSTPLDQWFGTFRDGSDEAHEPMNRRFMERNAKMGARSA